MTLSLKKSTHSLYRLLATSILALGLATSLAPNLALAIDSQELPDVKAGIVSIRTIDPVKRVGYTVGDVIEREVILTIKAPYKLVDTSLPIIGYEKRYKGQLIGIELKDIVHTKDEGKDKTTHHIKLAYQVFTNNVVAKNASLGPEYLNLSNTQNKQELVKYRIPSLDIAISPIAIFGQVKIENNMSQLMEPLLLPKRKETTALKASLAVLGLSLLALLYIVGMRAWLPLMGGQFAKAYRAIRKQPNTPEGIKLAVAKVHEALNATAARSVFSTNLDEFLAEQPNFVAVKAEIEQFFSLSRQVYFEPGAAHALNAEPRQWLQQFARRCRDCERGLTPTPLSNTAGK